MMGQTGAGRAGADRMAWAGTGSAGTDRMVWTGTGRAGAGMCQIVSGAGEMAHGCCLLKEQLSYLDRRREHGISAGYL